MNEEKNKIDPLTEGSYKTERPIVGKVVPLRPDTPPFIGVFKYRKLKWRTSVMTSGTGMALAYLTRPVVSGPMVISRSTLFSEHVTKWVPLDEVLQLIED